MSSFAFQTTRRTSPCSFLSHPGTLKLSSPSFTYIERGEGLKAAVSKLTRYPLIGIDIETTGLDPIHDQILLIQLGTEDHVYVFDARSLAEGVQELRSVISNPNILKLGQNLSFEWCFLEHNRLPLRGKLLDTMIGGKLINLGRKAKNSLGALVERYLGQTMEEKEELQKSFIGHEGPFTQEQLEYAARDVSVLFPLYKALRVKLRTEELTHIFRLECRALPAFASMKYNGFYLDVEYYKQLLVEKEALRDQQALDVIRQLDRAGALEPYVNPETGDLLIHPDSVGKGAKKIKGFNLGSTAQLQPALKRYGVPVEKSLDKNALAFLAPDHEIIRLYLQYKELSTACSQIKKLIGHAENYADHRIRAGYRQLGTDTGRASCADPNLQQVKRDKEYRAGFKATPGHVLVIADYSQLELRIAAECSGEERMAQAYREGADLHTRTASLMLGKSEDEVTKPERQSSKIMNFGALYGSGATSIRKQAVAQYGVDMTLKEAEEKLNQWRRAYPQLIGWQKTQGGGTGLVVYTLMGRRRLLVPGVTDKYTVRLNTQVQGSGGDCMKAALALLWEQYLESSPDIRLVACVHDEAVLEVPEAKADEAQIVLKECMESAAYEVGITNVPILAEPGSGSDWSAK